MQGGQQIGQNPAMLYFDGFTIDDHGDIRIPQLGTISALGLTTEELRKEIEKRLFDFIYKGVPNNDVFVDVKLAGINYTMVGEVVNPGLSTIFREKANVIEAIATSGGIPITGDLTDVKIIRRYPDGVRVHHINAASIDAVNSPYYQIQPNDMIVVDPLPQKTLGIGTTGLQTFISILTVVTSVITIGLIFTR
jgi:polysaccharide export outer membrane protein